MIPHNNELNAKFAKRGLVVVGVTNEDEKLVEKYVADNKVEYPIFIEKSYRSSQDLKINGYPSAVLVDAKGVVVWSGHPASLDEATIEKALAGAHAPIVKMPPALKALEPLIAKQDYGKAWSTAKTLLAGALDEEAKTTATDLVADIEADAKKLMTAADAHIADKHCYEAQGELEQVIRQYTGVAGAETAGDKLKALLADVESRKAIKAGEQLAKAIELEQAKDFDKAWAAYKAVATGYAGTLPATEAAAKQKELESKSMLGFDKKCENCGTLGHACPKHKKKTPK